MRRSSSAQDRNVASHAGSFDGGRISASSPMATLPVVPSIVIQSPSRSSVPSNDGPLVAAIDVRAHRSRNARLAHSPRDDRRVRRRAALGGQNAFRGDHAVHVVGRRLGAHEDTVLRPCSFHVTASSAENTIWPAAAPGEALSPLQATLDLSARIDARVKELIERLRVDHSDGAPLVDQALR